jgi:dihydroxyacetone kinase phosphoprotein-dependent L subunit
MESRAPDGLMADVRFSWKLAAEFIGTAALVVCGPGTVAATGVVATSSGAVFSVADLGVIALAFTMVIVAMIYTIGHISGCHINPAVTVALAVARKVRWSDVPGYLAAQFAGGIAGAFAIWSILEQPGVDAGLGVLSYTPGHARAAFCAELIGTFLLVLVIFGTTTDSRATPGWYGLAIPAIVFAVITVVGPVTGAALNPARYLGPMIARAALGAGTGLHWNQTPIYLTAAFIAGLLAAATYAFLGAVPTASSHRPPQSQRATGPRRPTRGSERRAARRGPDRRAAPGTGRLATHEATLDAAALYAWVRRAAQMIEDNTHYLTHLDAVIGDADHGTNMGRGFKSAVITLEERAPTTPGAVLDIAGQAFMSNLGGAAGPLYGAGFGKAAEALGHDGHTVSAAQLGAALRAALAGIQELGAAEAGDKTMVDAWSPAVAAYQSVIDAGGDIVEATAAAAEAAERGLHATVSMQARKGRASYIGARTIGHADPGAASSVLILRALAASVAGAAGVATVGTIARAPAPWWRE